MVPKIAAFNIAAFVLLSFLLAASFFRRMTRGKTNRCFIYIILICLLQCIFDITSIYIDNAADPQFTSLQMFSHTGYLFLHNMTPPMYFMYIVAQTDTLHKFGKNRAETYFVAAPAVLFAAAFTLNIFTGMIFTVEDGVYHRGPMFIYLYLIATVFCIACVVYLIRCRALFTRHKLLAFISTFPLLLSAVITEFLYPQIRIEMFAVSIGLLFIAMFIQRPEALIDFNTGVYKFNAYAIDMKRNFANKKPVDVILINIANYLQIQDILSYDASLDMLKLVAVRISNIVDQSKTDADIYYLDKGRFRVVVNYTDHERAEYVAETINAALKPKLPLNGMELNLIAFVCVAKCPDEISDFNTIIEFGKDLSTKFKFTGKVLHAGELLDKSRYDLMSDLDSIITDAVLNRKFEVYYQPIYSLSEGRFRSAEALVRLYNEKYGFISPELFIPITEKTGSVTKIGTFVFEEVCKFISSSEFKELGLEYIEVNLSVVQCMQGGLAGDLLRIMKQYGVTPDQINLEITESADSSAQSIIAENLTALLNAGLSFSLDDFGTGYSNMQRMASLPLKIVKLDKTFANFDTNPRLMVVLQNTVRMIKDMDLEIVVEGVETQDLVDRFTALDCEYIQGYFFSRPIPKDQFVEFIRSNIPVNRAC